MQSTNLINSLQAMYRSARPLIVAETLTSPVTKLDPGQRVQATIQEQVSPGLFKVEIAGQVMQMQLPGQLKIGNQVQLQVMSNNPRLTFNFVAVSAETLSNPATKLEPGQRIQATIQEQVSPGLFKVEIAGQVMQMQLPGQLKSGNQVQLQVMSNNPRLTFNFIASSTPITSGEQTSSAASSNPIATHEQISSTSRFLSNLTELPLERALIQSTAGKPVWQAAGTAIDSKQMAVALKDALGNSGLFYESHQAQWVSGERSTAQLLIEPQNQLQNRDTQALAAPPDKAALAFQQDKAAIQPDKAAISMQPDKATPDSGVPMARELVSMVQQQLHTLETHQLTWTGQIWPGQQMQWEIQGEPEHHKTQADERKWSTEVELALPKLGDVHARFVFSQGGIKLTLHAADASAIALLNQHLPVLATTMSIAGIRLNSAVIEKT